MDQVNFQGWVGRVEKATGRIEMAGLNSWMSTLTDETPPKADAGQSVAPLAHWIAFPPSAGMAELGDDGHPKLGGFLPPVHLSRRMWAGGSLTFHQPLHAGETLTRTSHLKGIEQKDGAAGPMLFVQVDHEISGQSGLAISERQDIVYLPMPDRFVPPKKKPAPEAPDICETFEITRPRLFRYSAVTFNAHRIHYDLPYAQDVEKFPNLVVHGPLQATALLHLAARHAGTAPTGFRFRSVHPMFAGEDMHLLGVHETENTLHLCTAAAQGGHVGMQATATWGIV